MSEPVAAPASAGATFAANAMRLAGQTSVLLGWRPDEFWRATPEELATVIGALAGEADSPAGRDELARLKEMFPDG